MGREALLIRGIIYQPGIAFSGWPTVDYQLYYLFGTSMVGDILGSESLNRCHQHQG